MRLIFILGFSGDFSKWCADLIGGMLARSGRCDVIAVGSPYDFAMRLPFFLGGATVVLSSNPGTRMIASLHASNREVIVIEDDPRHAVMALCKNSGYALADAVRDASSAAATIEELAALNEFNNLLLNPSENPSDIVAKISNFLRQGNFSTSDLPAAPPYEHWQKWWGELETVDQQLISDALKYYWEDHDQIRWQPCLFFSGDSFTPAAGPIDITGLPRPIITGPTIRLSAGSWRITFQFLFDDAALENSYAIDAINCGVLVENWRPTTRLASIYVDLEITNLSDFPVQVVLRTEKASFDGELELLDCIVRNRL